MTETMAVGDEVHFSGLNFDQFIVEDEDTRDSVIRLVSSRIISLDSVEDFHLLHIIALRCLNFLRAEGGSFFRLPEEIDFRSFPRPLGGQTSNGFALEIGGLGIKSLLTPWGEWQFLPPQFESFGNLENSQARSSVLARLIDTFDGKRFTSERLGRETRLPIQGRYGLRCVHFRTHEEDIHLPWPSFLRVESRDEQNVVISNWRKLLMTISHH